MKDIIKKWWNRTWSDWHFEMENREFSYITDNHPSAVYEIYKRTSNDGLVQFKKVRKC